MPGKADGTSNCQFSPSRSPLAGFFYPILSPIGFLSHCFILLSNFELFNVLLKFLRVPYIIGFLLVLFDRIALTSKI